MAMSTHPPFLLRNATQGNTLCGTLEPATTFWQRTRGLLGHAEQERGDGLLLLPSSGIHTFGMGYTIDVVFLNKSLQVLRICSSVPPWRVRLPARTTHCVLEMRKGEAERTGLAVGDRLQLQGSETSASLIAESQASLTPSSQPRQILWVLLAVLLSVQAMLCWTARKASTEGRVDLRAYYAAGADARFHGFHGLYNDAAEQHTQQVLFHDGWRTLHFLYPPFAVVPYAVLARLPYGLAFVLVALGSVAFLAASTVLLSRTCPPGEVSPVVLGLCALCAFPSVMALIQGQLSFVLLLVLTGFYCLERRGMHVLAGVCLAMCMVKIQVALPIAVLYLAWRRYRVVAGFAAGTAVLAAVSLALVGIAGLQNYAARLQGMGAVTMQDGALALARYGVHTATEPNLHGMAVFLLGDGAGSALLTLLLSAGVLVWSARQAASIGTAVCAALLLSYHLLPYDLVLLLLPMALGAMQLLPMDSAGRLPMQRSPALWLLAGSMLLLNAPVAAFLMLHNAMTWYVLASVAMLLVSAYAERPVTIKSALAAPHPAPTLALVP